MSDYSAKAAAKEPFIQTMRELVRAYQAFSDKLIREKYGIR